MQYYADSNIYRYEHGNFLGKFGGFNILSIVNKDFEIVQKQEEIDIDSIEKLEGIVKYATERNTINELIQAVKQLNKEVKELKKIEN